MSGCRNDRGCPLAQFEPVASEAAQPHVDPLVSSSPERRRARCFGKPANWLCTTRAVTDRAAARTVEALMFALRRGLDAIEHPDNQQRLSKLNDEQMREVAARLQKFSPHVAPEWTSTDVEALVFIWSKLRC